MQDKFIVTVGKMEFKEVAEKDSINPFRPGIPIESFMGLDIDLVKSNGSRPYRVWWSSDWISTFQAYLLVKMQFSDEFLTKMQKVYRGW